VVAGNVPTRGRAERALLRFSCDWRVAVRDTTGMPGLAHGRFLGLTTGRESHGGEEGTDKSEVRSKKSEGKARERTTVLKLRWIRLGPDSIDGDGLLRAPGMVLGSGLVRTAGLRAVSSKGARRHALNGGRVAEQFPVASFQLRAGNQDGARLRTGGDWATSCAGWRGNPPCIWFFNRHDGEPVGTRCEEASRTHPTPKPWAEAVLLMDTRCVARQRKDPALALGALFGGPPV